MSTVSNPAPDTAEAQLATDMKILNRSLSGEYFGIAAYEAAIGSGLLDDVSRQFAKQFQLDHEQHAQSLIEAIEQAGGTAGTRKSWDEMAAEFPPPPLETQEDVLRYAASLESSGASAEVVAVSKLHSERFRLLVASIAGVESMHWAVLRHALGENPVPDAFISTDG